MQPRISLLEMVEDEFDEIRERSGVTAGIVVIGRPSSGSAEGHLQAEDLSILNLG